MRSRIFAKRNFTEILRDPVSYIFGLGFPIIMLIIMTVINQSIPPEAGMKIFDIENLSCGMAVFSLSFTMLCAAMLVSKDRAGAFLQRLYSSPMRPAEFIAGYLLPLLAVAFLQVIITFISSAVICLITGENLRFSGVMFAIVSLLPAAVTFVSLGIAIGFLLGEKSAPPACSIIISASGLLGGIWFDCKSVGGAFLAVCRALPFLNAVDLSRGAIAGNANVLLPFLIICGYAVLSLAFAIFAFTLKRKTN
ncbi:MAG: ABC transporter permease [Clostridia bacterium]|nr:ABC transporter permease [Clostridia bacterium]